MAYLQCYGARKAIKCSCCYCIIIQFA